jgi:excisionase family DNA binding protein
MATAGTHPRLLRLDEAAIRYAYSVTSLRRAIRRGDLEAVRLGPSERHALRIPEDALERWLRPARQEGAA